MMHHMSPNNLVKIQLGSEREPKNTFDFNLSSIHNESFGNMPMLNNILMSFSGEPIFKKII